MQRVLKGKALFKYIGCSAATFYRHFRTDNEFPLPVRLGAGMNGYLKDEVDAYLESRPRVRHDNPDDTDKANRLWEDAFRPHSRKLWEKLYHGIPKSSDELLEEKDAETRFDPVTKDLFYALAQSTVALHGLLSAIDMMTDDPAGAEKSLQDWAILARWSLRENKVVIVKAMEDSQ
ncbi:MAG: AlpA family phage regulatory protein [Candidatus Thiodiazotropha endolucinida]